MPEGRAGSRGCLRTANCQTASRVSSAGRAAAALSATWDWALVSRIKKGRSSGGPTKRGYGPFLQGS